MLFEKKVTFAKIILKERTGRLSDHIIHCLPRLKTKWVCVIVKNIQEFRPAGKLLIK